MIETRQDTDKICLFSVCRVSSGLDTLYVILYILSFLHFTYEETEIQLN